MFRTKSVSVVSGEWGHRNLNAASSGLGAELATLFRLSLVAVWISLNMHVLLWGGAVVGGPSGDTFVGGSLVIETCCE